MDLNIQESSLLIEKGNVAEDKNPISINADAPKEQLEEKQKLGTQVRTGTMLGSIFNMANTVIGAGVLSFPFTYCEAGLLFGIFLTVLVVVLSGLSMHIIVLCARSDPSCRSYQDVIRLYLGEFAVKISEFLFVANLIGAQVCFLVIIGDSIEPVLQNYFGTDSLLTSRMFIIIAVAIIVVFPLCLLREVKKLEFSSTIALIGVGYLTIMVTLMGIIQWSQGDPLGVGVDKHWGINTSTYMGIPKMIISVPIIALSFQGIEIICLPIYYELKNPSLIKMDIIIFSAMFLSMTVYIIVGIFGFLQFGDIVNGNILLSYGGDNIPAMIARGFIGVTVTLSYPLIFFACRLAVHSFVVSFQAWMQKKKMEDMGEEYKKVPAWEFLPVTIIGHLVSVAIALVVPNISDVFGIVGSFGSITFVFIFPLLLLTVLIHRSKMSLLKKVLLYIFVTVCILLAFSILVLGETVTILKMVTEGETPDTVSASANALDSIACSKFYGNNFYMPFSC